MQDGFNNCEGSWPGTGGPKEQQPPIQREVLWHKASMKVAKVEACYGSIWRDLSKSELELYEQPRDYFIGQQK